VAPLRVVPAFDVAEDGQARLGVRREAAPREQLAPERGEARLGHRAVVRVAPGARRRPNA
jgi:hypothetical protein